MSHGYTIQLQQAVWKADPESLGVQLGRYCIDHAIPVADVAALFGVSRMTIYNWFTGANAPSKESAPHIQQWIGKKRKT
jgi:predicted DNA-binding transcriptional regulator AlpA